jgi:Ca2+-transporting ATPase
MTTQTTEGTAPQAQVSAPARGLAADEAARRLVTFGPNDVRSLPTLTTAEVLASQFANPVVLLLIASSAIALAIGERLDAAAIAVVVVLNAGLGFAQEYRADRALAALRAITAPRARVVRDGSPIVIPAREVVPGDALMLEAGDLVPADARLREAHAFSTNEALLTGESEPVDKAVTPVRRDAPIAERRDCVFAGTSVLTGTAMADVTATGMSTELGRIATLLQSVETTATPLQRRLAVVTRTLILLCLAIVAVVAAIGLMRHLPAYEVFLSAVSLAVAAVPEGLPAFVTIALAVGVERMAARRVLVRRLASVETLGCATVICTDKTGTLTTGVMSVRELWGTDHGRLLFAASACSDAEPAHNGHPAFGDPTELAILDAAASRGVSREQIERTRPRVRTWPFDPMLRRMAIERADGVTYHKGAVETILRLCGNVTTDARTAAETMAARGLRVLAVATSRERGASPLGLIGLIGIADPPRPDAIEAVAAARRAGITTVMLTGDHATTARAVAGEFGIVGDDAVFARATPEDKLRIVREWKARGHVVAMTGDGVNDAPALREAHIGIAMGRTGTEVTREAADMILADDNFASIVAAVREGRGIFENIRKTLVYLLTGNASELIVMLTAAVAGLPMPLLPLHLLWINIVTDGLPSLALVMDPAPADALSRPPRGAEEEILGRDQWTMIALAGLFEASLVMAVFTWAIATRTKTDARTLAFGVIVFAELFRAFAARSTTRVFWTTGIFTNMKLLAVVVASALAQVAVHHVEPLRTLLGLAMLTPADMGLMIGVGLIPVSAIELSKLLPRR